MRAVQDSAELQRIKRIPKRNWTKEQTSALQDALTQTLKTPDGTWTLKPIQAVALTEIGQWKGGFFPIRVGGGKTLISLLAPRMVAAKRPLLLIPASLRDKTNAEQQMLRKHWRLPAFTKIISYQALSRVGGLDTLNEYRPDIIIADECHYLKNTSAACTKRVGRYMRANYEDTAFVAMSGTITKRSIRDFAHIAGWCLKITNPCPEDWNVMDEWSRALDVNVAFHRKLLPGALSQLKEKPTDELRVSFRKRLVQSPGVVATQETPLPIELKIKSHTLDSPKEMMPMWQKLRDDYETPDGWQCADAVEVWRHAKELAVGMYYIWSPRPEPEWMSARSDYGSCVRQIIKNNNRRLDTELQVRNAIAQGLYPAASSALEKWKILEPSFTPNVEAVWVSDHAVDWILEWAKTPGIVWVGHRFLGHRLDQHGLTYYGQEGKNSNNKSIEDAPTHKAICASIDANSTGRNLQHWNRNLIVGVPPNGAKWEQLLGRTHRDGQRSKTVTVDVLMGCKEDVKGFWRAVEDSQYAEDMTGQAQKLTNADLSNVITKQELRKDKQWDS